MGLLQRCWLFGGWLVYGLGEVVCDVLEIIVGLYIGWLMVGVYFSVGGCVDVSFMY